MKKIIFAVFSFIIISACFSFAFADEDVQQNDNVYKIVDFQYKCGGLPTNVLTPNSQLDILATVKKIGQLSNDITLLVGLYDDGNLIDATSETLTFSEVGQEKSFNDVKLVLPSDTSRCTVEAYIWTDWLDMNPLAQFSTFGSDNPRILRLSINGYYPEEFDSNIDDGEIIMPFFMDGTPKVDIECEDLATNAVVDYTDGILNIEAQSHGGSIKKYRYVVKEPQPTCSVVLEYLYDGITKKDSLEINERGMKAPEYIIDDEGNYLPFGDKLMTNATWLYLDQPVYFTYIPEELKDSVVFISPRLYNTDANAPTDYRTMVAHVTLNKSATFYFPAMDYTYAKSNGEVWEDEFSKQITVNQIGNLNAWGSAATATPSTEGVGFLGSDRRFAIDLIVPTGETEKTFDIKVCGSQMSTWKQYGPSMFLKWK